MALHTLGTSANTSLNALAGWSQILAAADIAAISQTITDDRQFASLLSGYSFGATAVIGTGNTHTSTTLDTLAGVSGAPLGQIMVGDLVLGAGIPAGTFVVAKPSGSSVTLSQAAASTVVGANVAFCRLIEGPNGLGPQAGELIVPNRGILKVLPADVIAVDPITGWPILVSSNAIATAGSVWHFV